VSSALPRLASAGCERGVDLSSGSISRGIRALDLTDHIAGSVGKVLVEQGVPLRLVGVQVSNMKPDDSVVEAQVAQKAAEARTAAIKALTDFLTRDPTGTRKMVYRMQVLQELTRTANANGHNTIFLTDLGGARYRDPPVADRSLTLIRVSCRAARRRGAGGR
jgi:hypothetical protein